MCTQPISKVAEIELVRFIEIGNEPVDLFWIDRETPVIDCEERVRGCECRPFVAIDEGIRLSHSAAASSIRSP